MNTWTSMRSATIACIVAAGLATPVAAQCPRFLYWAKTPVSASNVPTCYSRVRAAANTYGLTGIRQSAQEVAGSKGGTYVAVTCVGAQPRAVAVVMAVGGNEADTRRVADELRDKIARTQGL